MSETVAFTNGMITGMTTQDILQITLVLNFDDDKNTYGIQSQTMQVIRGNQVIELKDITVPSKGGSATDETKSSELFKIMPNTNNRKPRQIHNKSFSNRRRRTPGFPLRIEDGFRVS